MELKNIKTKNISIKMIKDTSNKICKICKIEKNIESFVFNNYLVSGKPLMKTTCKECHKIKSKEYYEKNKKKVLKNIKEKYKKEVKTEYTYIIKFNNLNDVDKQINLLKEKFTNGTFEVKKNKRNNNKTNDDKFDEVNHVDDNNVDNNNDAQNNKDFIIVNPLDMDTIKGDNIIYGYPKNLS